MALVGCSFCSSCLPSCPVGLQSAAAVLLSFGVGWLSFSALSQPLSSLCSRRPRQAALRRDHPHSTAADRGPGRTVELLVAVASLTTSIWCRYWPRSISYRRKWSARPGSTSTADWLYRSTAQTIDVTTVEPLRSKQIARNNRRAACGSGSVSIALGNPAAPPGYPSLALTSCSALNRWAAR